MSRFVPSHPPVAENPQLFFTRAVLVVGLGWSILIMCFAIYRIMQPAGSHTHLPFPIDWFLPLLFLFWGLILIRGVVRLRFLRRVEVHRFAAAMGERPWLATLLPPSIHSPLTLPPTMALRSKKTSICFGCILVFIALAPDIGYLAPHWLSEVAQMLHERSSTGLLSEALLVVLFLGPCVLVMSFLFFFRTSVSVTETSLKIPGMGEISWQEAHLFACYHVPSLIFGRRSAIWYELSSPDTVLIWQYITDPQSPLTTWKPSLPPEDYRQQMQALCHLVVARTGLPLYDLTQPVAGENPTSNPQIDDRTT